MIILESYDTVSLPLQSVFAMYKIDLFMERNEKIEEFASKR